MLLAQIRFVAAESFTRQLVEAPELAIRHSLVRDLLTKPTVHIEFGPKYESQVYGHLNEVLNELHPAVDYLTATGTQRSFCDSTTYVACTCPSKPVLVLMQPKHHVDGACRRM